MRVSPRFATLYAARGATSTIPYSTRLVDSAGVAQPLSASQVRWSVAGRHRGSIRLLGRPRADTDGVTVRVDAEAFQAGRDTVFATFAGGEAEPGLGAVVAYEWAETVTRRPRRLDPDRGVPLRGSRRRVRGRPDAAPVRVPAPVRALPRPRDRERGLDGAHR